MTGYLFVAFVPQNILIFPIIRESYIPSLIGLAGSRILRTKSTGRYAMFLRIWVSIAIT